MELADKLCERLQTMVGIRAPYESLRKELAEHYLPHKKAQNTKTPGEEGTEFIWDSTPTDALTKMVARMYGMEMSPDSRWLGMGFRDLRNGTKDSDEFKKWCAQAADTILDVLANEDTGAYTAHHQCTTDKVLLGMYTKYIEEDDESLLRVKALPIDEVYVSENAQGVVDTVYRKYSMTVRQVIQTWGKRAVSQSVRDLWDENKPEDKVELLHCIYPRTDMGPGKKGNRGYPIACVYLEVTAKHILEETGYHEMPMSCPRWETGAGEVYGRGPALTALADVRVLYAEMRTAMLLAETQATPRLLLPDDGTLNPNPSSDPGGILYFRNADEKPSYLEAPGDLGAIGNMVERTSKNIRQIFMSNELDDPASPVRSATEVTIKNADRWQYLGAVLGRSQSEGLAVEVKRMLNILMRRGVIDPLPEGYTMRNLRVFYTNQLSLAQKQGQAQGMRVLMELLGPLLGSDGSDPLGIRDNFDFDVYARKAHDISGMDPDMLLSKQKVAATRDGKAKAQAQAQTIATLGQGAEIAKTASEADMSVPNGLTALVGGMG